MEPWQLLVVVQTDLLWYSKSDRAGDVEDRSYTHAYSYIQIYPRSAVP